jgi:hypothetical protein
MADLCSYRGCSNPSIEGRMFCSAHIDGGVSDVASFQKRFDLEEQERRQEERQREGRDED